MDRLKNKIKESILKIDLFSHGELLRVKGEGAYQTYTGAIFSIFIIVGFIILFYNEVIKTINRDTINFILKTKADANPASLNIAAEKGKFMFGVGLQGFDLSQTQRYFDIVMLDYTFKNGKQSQVTEVPLQPCTLNHWDDVNSDVTAAFTRLGFSQYLCPPLNHNLKLQGKYTSITYQFTKLSVRKCNQTRGVLNNYTCVNPAKIDEYITVNSLFKLNVYFINPIINPSQKIFLEYYLQDRAFFQFTNLVGASSDIVFSPFQINTDKSIWPEPAKEEESINGIIFTDTPVSNNFQVTNNEYAKINIRRSPLSLSYERSFKRLDNVLSYIGGLFSIFLIFMYGMMAFSQYSYEYSVGSKLYVDNQNKQFKKKLNIFNFWIYLLYCAISFIYEGAKEWSCFSFYRKFDECREQIKHQLDVTFLMKRIVFIQKAIELNFRHKLDKLDIDHKWTINQAKKKRQLYNDHQVISNLIQLSNQKSLQSNKKRISTVHLADAFGPGIILYPPTNSQNIKLDGEIIQPPANNQVNINEISFVLRQINDNNKEQEGMSNIEANISSQYMKARYQTISNNSRMELSRDDEHINSKGNSSSSGSDELIKSKDDKENVNVSQFQIPIKTRPKP